MIAAALPPDHEFFRLAYDLRIDMASFSQRIGLKPMHKVTQLEGLDDDLRTGLWNALTVSLWERWEPIPDAYSMHSRRPEAKEIDLLVRKIWFNHFKKPIDSLADFDDDAVYGRLKAIVLKGTWVEAYDLIDFIVDNVPEGWKKSLSEFLNAILEKEYAGYRFVNDQLVPITAAIEIQAIETAIERSSKSVRVHLERALSLLSDRNAPDHRNSIKESISAVEAACQAVAGMPNATLNDCLKEIKKKKTLHPAFEQALTKLYGYTSDASGIRHSLTEEGVQVTHSDAQFMLVSCSAFTNYLLGVAAEQNMEIK